MVGGDHGADEKAKSEKSDEESFVPLSAKKRQEFQTYLASISDKRQIICEGMVFALEHAKESVDVVRIICEAVTSCETVQRLTALLYLISDISFNSAKITGAWSYKREFEHRIP